MTEHELQWLAQQEQQKRGWLGQQPFVEGALWAFNLMADEGENDE